MNIAFDPFVTDWRHDPFPIYAAMREQAPVYVSEPSQTFCISRYDDVLHVLKHPELFSSGVTLCVLIGSANRDERRFAQADRFDVTRGDRGHLAFGFGAHFCLGSALARLEATAAFEGVLPLLEGYRRVDDRPPIIDSFLVRGRQSLELEAA